MHIFKRFYLLATLLFSLIVPALVFTEYVEEPSTTETTHAVVQQTTGSNEIINVPPALEADVLDIAPLLWGIYFLGLLFFGIQFIKNLFQIFRRIRRNPKQKSVRFTQILLLEKIPPHTFFRYIFLNKKKLESNEIPKEVLLHEETHARQKPSFDVVFVEMLQVIFWINPFIYLIKKAIKLNHEFLADQAVLKKNIETTTYQNTLLSYLSPDSEKKYQPKLANAINYSSIKKRFTIMKKQTSKKGILLRSLLLLPILATLLYSFTETIIIQKEAVKTETTATDEILEQSQEKAAPEIVAEYTKLAKKWNLFLDSNMKIVPSEKRRLEQLFKLMSTDQKAIAQPFPDFSLAEKNQEGATAEQLKEYNSLAKKYNEQSPEFMSIRKRDVDRLTQLYDLMTDAQKAAAAPFPDFPPLPEVPSPPSPPKVKKGEVSAIPPPPPPTPDQVEEYVNNIIETQEINAVEEVVELSGRRVMFVPRLKAPPTPPKSPLDHVIEMAKKDAIFYHEGKEITSDKAIQILKNSTKINIDTRRSNGEKPVVRLSAKPIRIE